MLFGGFSPFSKWCPCAPTLSDVRVLYGGFLLEGTSITDKWRLKLLLPSASPPPLHPPHWLPVHITGAWPCCVTLCIKASHRKSCINPTCRPLNNRTSPVGERQHNRSLLLWKTLLIDGDAAPSVSVTHHSLFFLSVRPHFILSHTTTTAHSSALATWALSFCGSCRPAIPPAGERTHADELFINQAGGVIIHPITLRLRRKVTHKVTHNHPLIYLSSHGQE